MPHDYTDDELFERDMRDYLAHRGLLDDADEGADQVDAELAEWLAEFEATGVNPDDPSHTWEEYQAELAAEAESEGDGDADTAADPDTYGDEWESVHIW